MLYQNIHCVYISYLLSFEDNYSHTQSANDFSFITPIWISFINTFAIKNVFLKQSLIDKDRHIVRSCWNIEFVH